MTYSKIFREDRNQRVPFRSHDASDAFDVLLVDGAVLQEATRLTISPAAATPQRMRMMVSAKKELSIRGWSVGQATRPVNTFNRDSSYDPPAEGFQCPRDAIS